VETISHIFFFLEVTHDQLEQIGKPFRNGKKGGVKDRDDLLNIFKTLPAVQTGRLSKKGEKRGALLPGKIEIKLLRSRLKRKP